MLSRARRQLYCILDEIFASYSGAHWSLSEEHYYEIRAALRRYFRPALSDTTRPNNDTDLWEHAYSVASILKPFICKRYMGETVDERPERISESGELAWIACAIFLPLIRLAICWAADV